MNVSFRELPTRCVRPASVAPGTVALYAMVCVLALVRFSVAPAGEPNHDVTAEAPATEHPPVVGCPLAPGKVKLIENDIRESLEKRGMTAAMERFKQYAAAVLDRSAGRTRSELSGNCRLSWFDGLLRDPLRAPAEAERFSRELHTEVVRAEPGWLDRLLVMAGEKLDLELAEPAEVPIPQSPEEAIELLKQAVEAAHAAQQRAIAPLSTAELKLLEARLYTVLTGEVRFGHTLVNRATGRQLLDLLELKMDRAAMLEAGRALSSLANAEFLQQLGQLEEGEEQITVEGATGTILRRVETAAGAIIIGGRGNNTYHLDKMPDVCAVIDLGGDDRYHAAMWAQGFGGPLGFGLLDDLGGDDHFYAGGLYRATYPETPGYEGWAQGVGSGLRAVANGGIGVLLAGGGNNVYEFDYFGHGGGYWLGVGIARDFAGNDKRLGATRLAFDGSPRAQRRFQRFGNGFACHYALGFLFDDEGDDLYGGDIMGTGFGWDLGVGFLADFSGNDRYEAAGQHTQGSGAQASIGILFDFEGDDVYLGRGQGYASPSISYHPMPRCGGNFGFVIDYGGNDQYGSGARNNAYTVRGSQGGFIIDRPKKGEQNEEK